MPNITGSINEQSFLRSALGATVRNVASKTGEYKPVYYDDYIHSKGDRISDIYTSLNIRPPDGMSRFANFDRFYSIYPDYELSTLRQYVFIVRPDLNIVSGRTSVLRVNAQCKVAKQIVELVEHNPELAMHLTPGLSNKHDFMSYLVGRTESLQIPDISIRSYNIAQPQSNYSLPYAGNAIESQTGGSFDITFREDEQLSITKIFTAWMIYIDLVKRGFVEPKEYYIDYNRLDYATSVYYFVCDPTGEKILFWSKYTGAFPTSASTSNWSFNLRGSAENKLSVPFVYFMHEVLDTDILRDFNSNSIGTVNKIASTYDDIVAGSGNAMVGAPFVAQKGRDYYLRWRVLGS